MYPSQISPNQDLNIINNVPTVSVGRTQTLKLQQSFDGVVQYVRVINIFASCVVTLDVSDVGANPPLQSGQQLLLVNTSGTGEAIIQCSDNSDFLGLSQYLLAARTNVSVIWDNESGFVAN